MKGLAAWQRRLRERSEYYLRLAAMQELRREHPSGTKPPAPPSGGWLWRHLFVPLYRRVPWEYKARAMRVLRMTASGWDPPARRSNEPWRPPTAR